MDDNDAEVFTVANLLEMAGFAIEDDLAGVTAEWINTGKDVHQRGLARAVFAYDSVNLAAANFQTYVVQRFYAGKFLCNMSHFENIV
ncbi:hypothetical protein SDC9_188966 [bioreactor metagenome]|uniref:Uncharacterized protein n=1 Tax=bioreactor metagenome TaxID=1076179 RepID=A0A645HRC9_9ZZZZ